MRQVFLDTETTGLIPAYGHRVVEIACVEVLDSVTTGRLLHHYLDPQCEVPQEVVDIHGLTNEFLRGKPLFSDIAAELIEFVTGAEVVIHNAPFDLAFLDRELQIAGIQSMFTDLCAKLTDTLPAFRKRFPGQRCSLQALCQRQQMDLGANDCWHTALTDARQLAQLWSSFDHV
jgi:DNA polymerase-3 subunit epsilon